MTPINLDKEESVLVCGRFTREDTTSLRDNPSLLSAKVSFIKNTVVNLYVKGFTTYVFTSDGLFDLIVANIVAELNRKGMALASIFIKPYPEVGIGQQRYHTEDFALLTLCFSERKEDFDPTAFRRYLTDNTHCLLLPSKVRSRNAYRTLTAPTYISRLADMPLN